MIILLVTSLQKVCNSLWWAFYESLCPSVHISQKPCGWTIKFCVHIDCDCGSFLVR